MAILTGSELAVLRQDQQRVRLINQRKPVVNAALQSIEDWFEANRASLNAALNAATNPATLSVAEKRTLLGVWLAQKTRREGV